MTPGINLLPPRYAERIAERRKLGMTAAILIVLAGVLTVAAVRQGGQLRDAERRRDREQVRTAELQRRRAELAPFRQLVDGVLGRERVLVAAMGNQVSWAGVLSSLSLTFPSDLSLTGLNAESTLPMFVTAPQTAGRPAVIGSARLNGYSVESFTPGLERMLQMLSAVKGILEPRLEVGAAARISGTPVTTFEASVFLDGRALTRRYAEGLPSENRVDLPLIGRNAPGPAARTTTSPASR